MPSYSLSSLRATFLVFLLALVVPSPTVAQAPAARVVDGTMSPQIFSSPPPCWCEPEPRWRGWFHRDSCCRKKGAKVLFEWAICKEEEKDENEKEEENGKNGKNGENGKSDDGGKEKKDDEAKKDENGEKKNGNGKKKKDKEEEEGPERLQSDRPDFTEASSTVGRGRIQLETGYTYFRDRSDSGLGHRVTNHTHSFPEALLRIGLFADWFELRLGQNILSENADESRTTGLDDTYLGVKLALTEQQKFLPETAIILQATVPTGADAFSARRLMPGFNYLFGWDVVEDCLTLGGSFGINRELDDSDHYFTLVSASLTVGYTLTPNLNAYTEFFGLFPCGAVDPGALPQYYFDGGLQYFLTDDLAVDVRAGVGLNRHAADFFAGAGLVVRF